MSTYDNQGKAQHYGDQRIQVIHQLEAIWGTTAVMMFCEMNAFKYRMRIGKKDDPAQELMKINWYEKMALYMQNKALSNPVPGLGSHSLPLDPKFIKMLE